MNDSGYFLDRLRNSGLLLALGLLLFCANRSVLAQPLYFDLNECNSFISANGGIAPTGGGNVGAYRDPNISNAVPIPVQSPDGMVILQQSAIGASIVASPEGFENGYVVYLDLANDAVNRSTKYKTIDGDGQNGTNSEWNIRFPGVIDVDSGIPWPGGSMQSQNFFEDEIQQAAEYYRIAIRANPYDFQARAGLISTYQERMAAHIYAGNNASVFASKRRLVASATNAPYGETIGTEVSYWANAISQYQMAGDIFAEASTIMPDAATFESADYAAAVKDPFDVFARGLGYEAEAVQMWLHLSYFSSYHDPLSPPPFNPAPLLTSLQPRLDHLESLLLLASQYRGLPNYLEVDLALVNAELALLNKEKNTTIPQGLLSFVGQRAPNQGEVIGEYAPEYVPFLFKDQPGSPTTSFDSLMERANQLIGSALAAENEARNTSRAFDTDRAALTTKLDQIFENYNDQLGDLCGWIFADDGQLHADVLGSLLPPGDREVQRPFQSGESAGKIYQQYLAVKQAFTEVEAAHADQRNIYLKAVNAKTVGDLIANQSANLAQMYLANGESIAALDYLQGQETARITRQIAEEQAEEAEREASHGFWGSIFKGIAAVASAVVTAVSPPAGAAIAAWTSVATAVGDGLNIWANLANSHGQAALIRKTGDLQAQLSEKNAEIAAQKDRIQADEAATVQFAQRDQALWKTEEAWQTAMLDYDRAGLNVLMAEQRLLMQKAELADLHARVAYLIQEMRQAIVLNTQTVNPLARPDYRLWMDFTTRNAEETFLGAQEWLYLAAKAAQYRVNGSSGVSDISTRIEAILHARTAVELRNISDKLKSDIDRLYLSQGTPTTALPILMRIRNYVVQNNSIVYDSQGNVDTNQSLFETQVEGGSTAAASDEAWLTFLNNHTIFDPQTPSVRLEIPFSTSVNRPNVSTNSPGFDPLKARNNPLFSPTRYSDLLNYEAGNGSSFGIRINIRGRNLNNLTNMNVVARLRQEGASYQRTAKWSANPEAVRVWNLQPVEGQIICSVNGVGAASLSTPQFHERSAANDHWVLVIDSLEGSGGNNAALLSQLASITDIEITFSIKGFTN